MGAMGIAVLLGSCDCMVGLACMVAACLEGKLASCRFAGAAFTLGSVVLPAPSCGVQIAAQLVALRSRFPTADVAAMVAGHPQLLRMLPEEVDAAVAAIACEFPEAAQVREVKLGREEALVCFAAGLLCCWLALLLVCFAAGLLCCTAPGSGRRPAWLTAAASSPCDAGGSGGNAVLQPCSAGRLQPGGLLGGGGPLAHPAPNSGQAGARSHVPVPGKHTVCLPTGWLEGGCCRLL